MRALWQDTRSGGPELMDDRSIGGAELAQALRQLRVINRCLGAAWPTVEGVARLWRRAGRPQTFAVLDVGAGSGDLNRALLRWARRRGVALRLTLVDIHPETCAAAARLYANEPAVAVACYDLHTLPAGVADVVTAALFLHHFPTAELPAVLHALRNAARVGVVVNDLHRHPLAWAGIWLATQALSRNRMIRHDAPLSVLRGFQYGELTRLRATLPGLVVRWRPLFRWLLLVPCSS